MKFLVEKKTIFKSLNHIQSIVDKRNALPILSNILIEVSNNELTMSSTDMDISIKETVICEVIEEGATTINAQLIYDIIKKLHDESKIEIISNDGKILTSVSNSINKAGEITVNRNRIDNNALIISIKLSFSLTVLKNKLLVFTSTR